ncbi:UNVERIFIED_CONTAM: hypothetical protein GTU68_042044 [Idotea baltica]|nr:hypothetical protein [Idotea baltica]
MVKLSNCKYGTQLDKKGSVLLPPHITEVLMASLSFMTPLIRKASTMLSNGYRKLTDMPVKM